MEHVEDVKDDNLAQETQHLRYEGLLEIETADLYKTGITSIPVDTLFVVIEKLDNFFTASNMIMPAQLKGIIQQIKEGITLTPSRVYHAMYNMMGEYNGTIAFYIFTGDPKPMIERWLEIDEDVKDLVDPLIQYLDKKREALLEQDVLGMLGKFYTAHTGLDFTNPE